MSNANTKYAYYPGCSLRGPAAEYATSAEAVCNALGVELVEIGDWVCCGATPAHVASHLLSLALPLISCAQAEKMSLDVLTCCTSCYSRLKIANMEVQKDPELLKQVNEIIEEDYKAETRVLHLSEVLLKDVGAEAITQRVVKPLTGLKVAPYYGCLIARIPEELRIDKVENPTIMDDLIRATGAEVISWPYKTECCGASLTLAKQKTVIRLCGELLEAAVECGANCVAVACPLCQSNLDMYGPNAQRKSNIRLDLPIFYFTQLIGLSLGVENGPLGLGRLLGSPMPLLAELGLVEEKVYL